MAQFLIPAIASLPSLIGGIMDAVNAGKKLHGGKLMALHKMSRHPIHGYKIRQLLHLYHMMHPMQGKGGRMMHYARKRGGRVHYVRKRREMKRRGRGIAADVVGSIPIVGSLLGPLIRAFGGRVYRKKRVVQKRGRGLAPMQIHYPIAYGGLLGPGKYRHGKGLLSPTGYGGTVVHRKGYYKYMNGK